MLSKRVLILFSLIVLDLALLAAADDPGGDDIAVNDNVSVLGSRPSPPLCGTCPGKITQVYCKEDASGRIRDIAYLNKDTGLKLVGCASGDWTAGASNTLRLADNENIIKVKTCRSNPRTKLTVTFLTDYGNKMTCGNPTDPNNKPYRGRASSSSGPGGEGNTDGAEVRTASSRPVGRRPRNSRQLMQARGRNANKCVTNIAPKDPVWTDVPNWWNLNGNDGPVGRVGTGANEYFKYSTGRYFKDWDIFATEFKQKLNKTQNIPYDPAYYYRQVWPLASFQAQCDRRQYIKNVDDFCWNNDDRPNPTVPIVVDLGENVKCPTTPAEVASLQLQLDKISARFLEASSGAVTIIWDPIDTGNCVPGTPTARRHLLQLTDGNTTITLTASFTPGPNSTPAAAAAYLVSLPPVADAPGFRDACDAQYDEPPLQSVCFGTSINALLFQLPTGAALARRLLHSAGLGYLNV